MIFVIGRIAMISGGGVLGGVVGNGVGLGGIVV